MKAAGFTVERHEDHFADNTPDEKWLASVGGRGWIVLTHDQGIRRKANERDAVLRHGVPLLVLVGKAPLRELAESFIRTRPKIERFVGRHVPPYIAKVHRASPEDLATKLIARGRIELWLSSAD